MATADGKPESVAMKRKDDVAVEALQPAVLKKGAAASLSFSWRSGSIGAWLVLALIVAPMPWMAHAKDPAGADGADPIPPVAAPNYRAIVERYGPAVVGVTVDGIGRAALLKGSPASAQSDSPGKPSHDADPGSPADPVRGLGSGFIISKDGLILTNAHVVQGGANVTVTLDDRREFAATVLGVDAETDVAVLKVDAKNLPVVRLGDSNRLKVGDYVLAIGAPFGLEQTATSGIVSAVRRPLPDQSYVPFIQTDTAVNPGNSGGPLFNAQGEVVGINSQIYSNTGSYDGVSFAIPMNLAKNIADQIVASGRFEHGRLGVTLQQVTQPLAQAFGLPRPDGALVSRVLPGSKASAAGLKSGDVILGCNGQPINKAVDVSAILGAAQPYDKLVFDTWREGQHQKISVSLGHASNVPGEDDPGVFKNERSGLAVKLLSDDEKKQANVSRGLIVIGVKGPAARAGILPGDVLLSINSKHLTSVDDFTSTVAGAASAIALLVERDGMRQYVAIELY